MDDKNRALLERVIEDRLRRSELADPTKEEDKVAFKEAMDALSKQIELDKIDASHEEQLEKLKIENERLKAECEKNLRDEAARKSEAKKDRWVQIGTFGAGMLLGPTLEYIFKSAFARYICEFEKENTFISTPGRTLSDVFRFKKWN